jgi:predicted Rossmann fold flavoprotein
MSDSQKTYDLIVVGAGAAGLLAAGRAAERGLNVLLLEKMRQAGRKLRITGKGRCNITNDAPIRDFLKKVKPNGKFLYPAFNAFFNQDMIDFLNAHDVPTVLERGGRYFPESNQAGDVVDALIKYAENNGVEFLYEAKVRHLLKEEKKVVGITVIQSMQMQDIYADNILIATGGKSYPATGSTGDGYKLAKQAGHQIVEVHPALVPIEVEGDIPSRLEGLSLKNVNLSLWVNGKKEHEEFGEMLFTDFGLTGPIALTISREVYAPIASEKHVQLSIDFKPALDDKVLDARLQRDLDANGKKQIGNLFKQWLPSKLIPVFIDLLAIDEEKPAHQVSGNERKAIRKLMKNFRFKAIGLRSFREAIITAGGVDLDEINPKTMASKFHKNVFFAGEILDLDAETGGYNLQIAFSTAWLAAESVAEGKSIKS